MTNPLVPPLGAKFTVDRESFQTVLASAFAIQQSQMDSESRSAIVEVGRLVTSGELDVDRALHLIVDRTQKVANSDDASIDPPLGAQLSLPGVNGVGETNRPSGVLLSLPATTPSDAGLLWADTALDQAINDIAEQEHATEASAAAIALKRAEELVRRDSTETSAPPIDEPQPSAVNSMDIDFAAFPVCIPPTTTPRLRLRDPWKLALVILEIVLVLLLGWMVGRVIWLRTAHLQGPPPRTATTTTTAPAQPEEARQADPNPPPPVRQNSRRDETSSDSLVVYDHGRVVFRLKSPQRHGELSAPDPALDSPSKENVRVLERVKPEYPETAKQQHIHGLVVLEAIVGKDGAVEQLAVISGNSILATAASDAILKWRFKPFVQNGRAVPFETRVKVDFVLP